MSKISSPFLAAATQDETLELRPSGSWTAVHANALESLFDVALPRLQQATKLTIDMTDVRERVSRVPAKPKARQSRSVFCCCLR